MLPQIPWLDFRGPTSKGRKGQKGETGEERERGGEEREGMGRAPND